MARVSKQKSRSKAEREDIERRRKLKKDDPERTIKRGGREEHLRSLEKKPIVAPTIKLGSRGGREEVGEKKERGLLETAGKAGRALLTGGPEFERLRKEGRLHAGTAPIAPTAAVAAVATTGAKILKAKAASRQAISVGRLSRALKISEAAINKAIRSKQINQGINKIVNGVNVGKLAAGTGKKILGIGGAIASVDVLTQWYALDNVIGGQKFFMKDVLKELRAGTITQEAAAEAIAKSREIREVAIDKVRASSNINPLLWATRKLILTGVEGDEIAIDLIESQIENLGLETEPETEDL